MSTVVSIKKWKKQIMEAAAIHEDEIFSRLWPIAVEQHFSYCMNNQCCKWYALSKTDVVNGNKWKYYGLVYLKPGSFPIKFEKSISY